MNLRGFTVLLAVCAAGAMPSAAYAGPDDDSRLAFTSIEIATASAPADTILYDFGVALGLYAPALDAQLSFGGASAPLVTGNRTALDVVPSVGYHVGWNRRQEAIVQLYGAARVPLQRRSGAGLPAEGGWALAGEAGVRLWSCSTRDPHLEGWCLGVTVGTRYQVHVTDFQMGPAVLPSGSAVWSFPVSIAVAVNPEIR